MKRNNPKEKWFDLRKIGNRLSQMMMPHLSIFIAWGFINVVASLQFKELHLLLDGLEQALISYLLPLLIGYTGGKQVEESRGGTIAGIATIGMIIGTNSPQIIGAMIIGPLSVWSYVFIKKYWLDRLKDGYEMVANNILAGLVGGVWCLTAIFLIAPVINWLMQASAILILWFIDLKLLPAVSLVIEPLKVFFFNNTINHGVLTPLGLSMVEKTGQSVLFLLETNPGPGLGILLAYYCYRKKKAQSGGAALIHVFGGIHEVYFPYVLMEPRLFVALIVSGVSGTAIFQWFDVGLKHPVSPGSLILIVTSTPLTKWLGLILGIIISTLVSFSIAKFYLKRRSWEESSLKEVEERLDSPQAITRIIVACDAGIGSSAMGASLLRRTLQQEQMDYFVDYQSVYTLDNRQDTLVLVHPQLKKVAESKAPASQILTIENFLDTIIMYQRVNEALGAYQPTPKDRVEPFELNKEMLKIVLLYADNIRGSQTMAIERMRQIVKHHQKKVEFTKEAIEHLEVKKDRLYICTDELLEQHPKLKKLKKKLVVQDFLQTTEFEIWLGEEEV
ncbi:PTS transporter subunit EIIC [Enterococcus sp.]|uniref:PTS transporter subunit EIIC n=1 Tax=Enterococcus sp. TaxID=35783 RepID=UPI002FC92951